MRSEIRDRICRIKDLYGEARLNASRNRIAAVWNRQLPEDRLPFIYMPCVLNYYDIIYPDPERLDLALQEFEARAFLDDDFVPTLFPGCRQETIPSMFGAGSGEAMRIIHDEEDIDNLPDPEIIPGSAADEMLKTQRYLLEETEGAFPVNVMDMQGPVEVAAKMWGYEDFFITAYTNPDLCHRLMQKLSQAFIMLWEEQRKNLGDLMIPNHLWGWNYAPQNIGASLSSDGLVMVSNEFSREFYNPSTNDISRHFDGISVHSCGDFSATVPSLLELENLRCIHAGQMKLTELFQAGIRDQVTTIAFSTEADFPEAMALAQREKMPCFLTISDFWPEKSWREWTPDDRKQLQEKHRNNLAAAALR